MNDIWLKSTYFLFANNEGININDTLGRNIPYDIFTNFHIIGKATHFGAVPIATVRRQTGLAPGGRIGKIAGLLEILPVAETPGPMGLTSGWT